MPLYYEFGYISGFVLTLSMGMLTIFLQPLRREARLWALLSLWVSLWFLARYFVLRAETAEQALGILKYAYIPITLINPTYYHFALALVRKPTNRLLYVGYLGALVLGTLNVFSDLLISGVHEGTYFAFYEQAGPLYALELLNYMLFPALGVSEIFRCRTSADPLKKRQLDYMLAAAAIGFLSGLSTMPLVYRLPVPPFGAPLVAIYPLVSTYAILRHQLLDIRIIIRRTLIYSVITAFLSALYVAILVLGSRALDHWYSAPSLVSSGAAAALIAILFHPLRVRLNRWVDRRFPRESLDPVLFREATSTFAHEVKRPLVNISLPAQLALADVEALRSGAAVSKMADKLEERLRFIIRESHSAGEKIEAICELTGPQRAQREPVDIGEIINNVASSFRSRAEKNNIVFHVYLPEKPLWMQGNQRQLEIALGNLVRNGLDALIESQGNPRELLLSAKEHDKKIHIEVADNGPGIPLQNRKHIFDPWFTTKGMRGMGIGLYITQQIVYRHGGSIEVLNGPSGTGSRFRMEFSSLKS